MTISTYATLKTSIVSWLDINTADISAIVDDLVTIGEKRILREVFCKDTESALSGTISGTLAVPADYIKLRFAYINSNPIAQLERRSAEWIYANFSTRSANGQPQYIGRDGSNFIFGPYPDSGYSVVGSYYKKAGTLSSAVYDLFTNNPDLYLFACLAETEPVIGRDSRIPLWEAKYTKIKDTINNLSVVESSSGGSLQMRIG